MTLDPTESNPEFYKVIFENDRVRVLEYKDQPGDATTPHAHPDSVMYTLTSFRRRLVHGDEQRDVDISAGTVRWLDAQQHCGREHRRDSLALHLHRAQGGRLRRAQGQPRAVVRP